MPTNKVAITGHMVVKNEDRFVYFAIKSTLPYVSTLLITDTGSSDNTVKIIKSFKSKKIIFRQTICTTRSEVSAVRQAQLDATKTDWFWVIDGDEVYPRSVAEEVVAAIKTNNNKEGIVVRRYDLLGDIYHRQSETVGSYNLFGQSGHLALRAINKRIVKGLHLAGEYPMEGYYDQDNVELNNHDKNNFLITQGYLFHAMYLRRSSLGSSLSDMINRSKYKVELGHKVLSPLPEVFLDVPSYVADPLLNRSWLYELLAYFITPIKKLKRKYL